jgi:hypothetical protein
MPTVSKEWHVVAATAVCKGCDFVMHGPFARERAGKHAHATGHHVEVSEQRLYVYRGHRGKS